MIAVGSFRAFATGLQQLGKATGRTARSKIEPKGDPTVEAFLQHDRSLGWREHTLLLRGKRSEFLSINGSVLLLGFVDSHSNEKRSARNSN